MYLGANKYPEFDGKDKRFVYGCIKYAYEKERIGRRFWVVVTALLLISVVWGCWVDDIVPSSWKTVEEILFPIVVVVLFLAYIFYEVNTRIHDAVKKHILGFEQSELVPGSNATELKRKK